MTNSTNVPVNIKTSWSEQKAKLKERFSNITDTDLHYANGRKNEMLAGIELKLGKTKEELNKILSGL